MSTDSLLSSAESCSFRFLSTDGTSLAQPLEWTPCFVEACGLDKWEDCSLFLQGEPLELCKTRKHGTMGIYAEIPRCGAGRYQLELKHDSTTLYNISFIITPRKLGEETFYRLLDEVQFELPYGIAFSLQKLGGLAGITIEPWQESIKERELILLQRALYGSVTGKPGLLRLLSELSRNPLRKLENEEPWVKIYAVRRPSAVGLVHALCRPGNVVSHLPLTLPDRRAKTSLDTYENQVVLFLHDLVRKRLYRLARFKWPGTGKYIQTIEKMIRQLAEARNNAYFLNEVSPLATVPSHVSMVQMKTPAYQASLVILLELLRTLSIRLDHPAMEHPLESVPTLYQYWGTLLLIQALLQIGEQHNLVVTKQSLVRRDPSGLVFTVFPKGKAALSLMHHHSGAVIHLYPEKNFGNETKETDYFSLSYQKRPDICIELQKPGSTPRLLLFDPKYKLLSEDINRPGEGDPLRIDIDKMHTYRDAIRCKDNSRPVAFAGIMYPGHTKEFSQGLAALGCLPGNTGLDDVISVLGRFIGELLEVIS